MNVASGVEVLEIPAVIMGTKTLIYPTLIWDEKTTILVDAGFPGQIFDFRQAIMETGTSLEKIDKIIITHHDRDHIGSLRAIMAALPHKISVLAHEKEREYIEGHVPPVKVTMAEAPDSPYPPEMKAAFLSQKHDYLDYTVTVDGNLEDGKELPFRGGITVIHTPGHTPGHICLYIRQSKTLIAGDALSAEGGTLGLVPKFVNLDWHLAIKSLDKLLDYDIETVICYHGGVWRGDARRSIAELTGTQRSTMA